MQLGYCNSLIGQNRPRGAGDTTPGGTADVWLMEDGASGWLMEDGISFFLLEA